ncbi:acyl-CoA dehydrogenase family protein [Gordonia sp. VNK1]|uniref:acyl-CoA dehydrogenase family protein n=1 Tax=Gordonia oleivorans TaxID=3156618 RepID=UPI0032B40E36
MGAVTAESDSSEEISADEVRAALRDYFADGSGLDEVRRNRDHPHAVTGGVDRAGWRRLAQQVGLTSMTAPVSWGGLGLGVPYAVAAVEECGAALYPGPVRAATLLARMLGGIEPDDVAPPVRAGLEDALAGTAIVGASDPGDGSAVPEFRVGGVTGRIGACTHGDVAEVIVTPVQTADGPAIAAVAVSAGGSVERSAVPTIDLATPLADVTVVDVPAIVLVAPGNMVGLQRFRNAQMLLLAAEQVGLAQGCLKQMVEYASVREQFGVRIGTYQAISHRCARTAVSIAAARALVAAAAEEIDRGNDTAATQFTLLARAESADAQAAASDALIQVSGGIGFTWEHDAHLYFRRARATGALGGIPARLRDAAVRAGCLDLLLSEARS